MSRLRFQSPLLVTMFDTTQILASSLAYEIKYEGGD